MLVRYGTSAAEVTVNQRGEIQRGVTLNVYAAEVGGVPLTAVFQGGQATGGPIVSSASGRFVFEADVAMAAPVWVQAAGGTERFEVHPSGGASATIPETDDEDLTYLITN